MKPSAKKTARYLKRIRIATWCVLVIERLWPLCLPLILLATFFAALAWLKFFLLLPYGAHIILLALFALGAILSLSLLLRLRFPTPQEIDRRIEAESGLAYQPLSTQQDQLAGNTSILGQLLWHEHQRHMADRLENLQIGLPHPNIPSHDKYALRSVIFLLFVIGFAVSFGRDAGRLSDAFRFDRPINANPIRIDAWVTPPYYTHRPPVYLSNRQVEKTSVVEVPQGSVVTVRVANGDWRTRLVLYDAKDKVVLEPETKNRTSHDIPVYEVKLVNSATLSLSTSRFDKNWKFQVTPDRAPSIEWVKAPQRAMNGTLELDYKIDDDFGIAKGWVEITPAGQNTAITNSHPLYTTPDIALTLPRGGKGRSQTIKDLTNHPWAGSDMDMRLVVENGAGHKAESTPVYLTLPQRSFGNPLARAIIEQRRLLAQDATRRDHIADMLSALLARPDDTMTDNTHVLALYSLKTRLSLADNDDALRNVVNYMWDIANGIENGNLSVAEQRLKQTQQALRDALRNGASPEEIERLMNELRQAMENYISMLAQKNNDGKAGDVPADMQILGSDELEKRLQELEEMAKLGNLGAAEQMLAELEKMMNGLQIMPGGGQTQAGGKGTSQKDRMQKQMDNLADMMRRQQRMLDETHRLEEDRQRGATGEDQFSDEMNRLQQQQSQLQADLDRLQKELGKDGLQPGKGLAEAEKSMKDSQKALRDGYGNLATQNQADALDAMRRGAQDLMGQMREAMKKAGDGKADDTARHDPLGREQKDSNVIHDEGTGLPGEMDVQRARRILDEIRKRLGNLTPLIEKDYLERLLKFD